MHVAAKAGYAECVKVLVKAAERSGSSNCKIYSDLCLTGNDGETPLSLAIKGGHSQALGNLLGLYAMPDDIAPALYDACVNNDTECIAVLARAFSSYVNCGVDFDGHFDGYGYGHYWVPSCIYPIHQVIENGNMEALEALLSAGAHLDVRRQYDLMTPLHLAIMKRDEAMIKALLRKAYDLSISDTNEDTVLHLAARQGDKKLLQLILDKARYIFVTSEDIVLKCCTMNSKDENPLLIAVSKGWHNILDMLLDLYTDNTLSHSGNPLHLACKRQDMVAIKMILNKFPCLIDRPDRRGYYPVHTCAKYGDIKMMDYLRNAGANANVINSSSGCTVLHSAAVNRNAEILRAILQDLPQSVNAFGQYHNMPLYNAAECGNVEAVNIFLQ